MKIFILFWGGQRNPCVWDWKISVIKIINWCKGKKCVVLRSVCLFPFALIYSLAIVFVLEIPYTVIIINSVGCVINTTKFQTCKILLDISRVFARFFGWILCFSEIKFSVYVRVCQWNVCVRSVFNLVFVSFVSIFSTFLDPSEF